MRQLKINIPIGVGDLIYLKAALDAVKSEFSEMKIKFCKELIKGHGLDPNYGQFLDEIGQLFFSEPPYILISEAGIPFYGIVSVCNDNQISPVKPDLKHLLCKGNPLQLDSPYIVMVTKVRYLSRRELDNKILDMWHILRQLSNKYKIVILGEREVQMNYDYKDQGSDSIYSIYGSIKDQIPADKIIDLSIPALGISKPNLSQIQQDCLIMSNAKFVLTLGVGGGFSMATAVSNTIGYRQDEDSIANVVFKKEYPDAVVTKDWNRFLQALRVYL